MEVHTNGNARHIKDSNTTTTTTLIDNDQNIPELQPDEITGWRTINDDAAKLLGLDLNYCTIDRIPASEMTKDKFQKEYFGQKLGGYLLSEAIKYSFAMSSLRVWVHTCSLDHKNALENYLSRGMKIFKTETLIR